jgi:hypothetical protein
MSTLKLFRTYFTGNPAEKIRNLFDVTNKPLIHPYDLVHSFAFSARKIDDDDVGNSCSHAHSQISW